MYRNNHFLIISLITFFSFYLHTFVHGNNVGGVNPLHVSKYTTLPFKCFSNPKIEFSTLSIINDNYCDCPDCSDEPGTSATHESNSSPRNDFYCANKGFFPKNIYNSLVNDGICDCCDGSDEYDPQINGNVVCENTCRSLGESEVVTLKQRIATLKQGLQLKKDKYIVQGNKLLTELNNQLEENKKKLLELEPTLEDLRTKKLTAEKQEEIEKNLKISEIEQKYAEALSRFKKDQGEETNSENVQVAEENKESIDFTNENKQSTEGNEQDSSLNQNVNIDEEKQSIENLESNQEASKEKEEYNELLRTMSNEKEQVNEFKIEGKYKDRRFSRHYFFTLTYNFVDFIH